MPVFDPGSPQFLADPYPVYARLRVAAPLYPLMPGAWLATRYEEADRILRDPGFGKDYHSGVVRRYGPAVAEEPAFRAANRFLLVMNPPEHTRLRALLSRAFGVKQAPELRRLARRVAEDLVDGFVAEGHADLVAAFAYPLPVRVICALLNLRLEDSLEFQRETQALIKVFELNPLSPDDIAAANRASLIFEDYFRRVCGERRNRPGDDLISLLLRAEVGEDHLSEEEIIANLVMLFVAGHETTANMLGNTLLSLFRHPDQLALLKSRPELLPRAVDEALRYETSVHIAARVALGDREIAGRIVRRGDTVYIGLGAANRDPAVFDEPDRYSLERPEQTRKPLSFGGGIHYCLGARLARIELETALETLFRRLPGLSLHGLHSPRWRPTLTVRGLETLEAAWQG